MNSELVKILDACCNAFNVTESEVKSQSLRREVSCCRRAFAQLAKSHFPVSDKTISTYINKSRSAIQYIINTELYDNSFNRIMCDLKEQASKMQAKRK